MNRDTARRLIIYGAAAFAVGILAEWLLPTDFIASTGRIILTAGLLVAGFVCVATGVGWYIMHPMQKRRRR